MQDEECVAALESSLCMSEATDINYLSGKPGAKQGLWLHSHHSLIHPYSLGQRELE